MKMLLGYHGNPLGLLGTTLVNIQVYLKLQLCLTLLTSLPEGLSAAAAPTTPSIFRRLCKQPTNKCRNGECYVIGDHTRCICARLFTGDRCENVDMAHVEYAIIGNVVIFQWKVPPRLRGYSFIYYRIDQPNERRLLYKNRIIMSDDEHSVLVGNLYQGRASYRICIEDEWVVDRVMNTESVDLLSNCINLDTGYDWHTLAAWLLAIGLCCVAACLVYTQKNKIELLYFSGKPMAIYEKCVENGDVIKVDGKDINDVTASSRLTSPR